MKFRELLFAFSVMLKHPTKNIKIFLKYVEMNFCKHKKFPFHLSVSEPHFYFVQKLILRCIFIRNTYIYLRIFFIIKFLYFIFLLIVYCLGSNAKIYHFQKLIPMDLSIGTCKRTPQLGVCKNMINQTIWLNWIILRHKIIKPLEWLMNWTI